MMRVSEIEHWGVIFHPAYYNALGLRIHMFKIEHSAYSAQSSAGRPGTRRVFFFVPRMLRVVQIQGIVRTD